MLWVELGIEGTADHYGAIPNTRYELVLPDNSHGVWDWHAIVQATKDAWDEAARARAAGEQPVVCVVDQVGAIWDLLGEWTDNRARNTNANRAALAEDPNHEYVIPPPFWTAAGERWKQLQKLWLTFPGIVILIADGNEVTLWENEKPTKKKEWKVAGHKSFTRAAPIWVRLFQERNPQLVKLRKVVGGVQAGVDRPEELPPKTEFNLEWLIFERYGWDPAASGTRQMVPLVPGDEAPLSPQAAAMLAAVENADLDRLRVMHNEHVPTAYKRGEITGEEGRRIQREALVRRDQLKAAEAAAADAAPLDDNHRAELVGAAT